MTTATTSATNCLPWPETSLGQGAVLRVLAFVQSLVKDRACLVVVNELSIDDQGDGHRLGCRQRGHACAVDDGRAVGHRWERFRLGPLLNHYQIRKLVNIIVQSLAMTWCKICQRRSGVNFINVLRAAFTHADPKSAEKDSWVVSLCCAFGIYAHKSCL